MPTPNPLAPVKGAGTTLWLYTGTGILMQTLCPMLTGSAWQKLRS
jgi:hypothetical protein